jgi:hypothetical protein
MEVFKVEKFKSEKAVDSVLTEMLNLQIQNPKVKKPVE